MAFKKKLDLELEMTGSASGKRTLEINYLATARPVWCFPVATSPKLR